MAAVGTGADVKIGGENYYNVGGYSVVEDATPLDPSDLTGGFGQITVALPDRIAVRRTMGKELSLTDGSLGQIVGTVRNLKGDLSAGEVVANSRLGQLAVERTIQPFVGLLGDALEYYLSLCGITTGIVVEPTVASVSVKLPGGRFFVYDQIEKLGAAYGFETSLVSSNVVFRRPQQRVAAAYRDASTDWSLSQDQFAQTVQGYYYNTSAGTQIAYPVHGEVDEVSPYQVDSGSVREDEIRLDASLSSVEQPVAVGSVSRYDTSLSVYTVVDNADQIVSPAQWVGNGGRVEVTIGEDTRTLKIKIVAASLPARGPFRIAMPLGENEYFSSLRIRGTGVFWQQELMTLYIHDDVDLAPDEVGTLVDSEYMETADQLYHRLLRTAARYGTDRQTIRVTSGGVNRLGDSGSAEYPTIGDVELMFPGATIGSIATELGPTIADWNAELFESVRSDFKNQAFGNVAGARVLDEGSYYRIRTATITPQSVTYEAERDNTISDVYHVGETIADWNARWADRTIRDVNIAPLLDLGVQAPEFLYPGNDQFPGVGP